MNGKCRLVETDPIEDDQVLRLRQCAELETLAERLRCEDQPSLTRLAASLREIARRRKAHSADPPASIRPKP